MRRWQHYLIYEVMRTLDYLFPGWQAPRQPKADYLSAESYSFWLSRYHKGGGV
jgi:hypothetical protein